MWRKLRRIAVYGALVCGLLGLCAYVARDPVRDVLGRTASAWLSRRLNGTLEIGALRGSLFSSLVLRDVVLRDRAGLEVAHLDEVRLAMISRRCSPNVWSSSMSTSCIPRPRWCKTLKGSGISATCCPQRHPRALHLHRKAPRWGISDRSRRRRYPDSRRPCCAPYCCGAWRTASHRIAGPPAGTGRRPRVPLPGTPAERARHTCRGAAADGAGNSRGQCCCHTAYRPAPADRQTL